MKFVSYNTEEKKQQAISLFEKIYKNDLASKEKTKRQADKIWGLSFLRAIAENSDFQLELAGGEIGDDST